MNNKIYLILVLVLSGGSLNQIVMAQDQNDSALGGLQKNLDTLQNYYGKINEKLQPKRDPFAYTKQMYQNQQKQQKQQTTLGGKIASLLPSTPHLFTSDGMPIMKYRGFARSADGEVIGLLEIMGMGVYSVRVGDQIGLHEIVKELVLTVEGLNRNNIVIETGKLGKKMVIQ